MSGPSGPHDAVFRRVLGEPANAASQLRSVLPPVLVQRLELDRLARVAGSFVDEALRWRHSDLLFTAPLDGREAFVYVLIEHQSSSDPLMAFRMLRYVVRIWDQWLAEHPDVVRLPAVLPLVVHHNRREWSAPTQVLELVDLDADVGEAVREYLPRFRFLLDDLVTVDERALRARPLTATVRVTLLLLKIAKSNARLAADLRPWAAELRAVLDRPGGVEEFAALLRYAQLVGEAPADELRDLVATLGPDAEEAFVTTAEMLRAEGRAEGEARGRAETLIQLLTIKFGPLPQAVLDTVHSATTDQLRTWAAYVLTADTLDQALR